MRTTIALLLGALLVGGSGRADELLQDGNWLKRGLELRDRALSRDTSLTFEEEMNGQLALGYVLGAADSLDQRSYCLPHVQLGQIADVVVAYLKAHPERRHQMGAPLVHEALSSAFPCLRK